MAKLPEEKLKRALDQLTRSELVFCRGKTPHAVYTFKHALVRDAAYAGLLKTRRAQLHAAIAGALERSFPEVVEAEPETLAHHFTEAGLVESSLKYWLRAGRSAATRSANLEAIAHYQRGLELVIQLPNGSPKDRLELDLQLGLGPCLIATQGPASATAVGTFARARELCEKLGDVPEYLQVMFWLATASVVRGELPRAQEAIVPLLQRAEALGDCPTLLNAMRGHGMILLFMGKIAAAREVIERAVDTFNASDDAQRLAARAAGQDAGVAGLSLMSWALWILGHVDTATARITTALQRAEAIQHPHTQAYAHYYAAILYALRGDPAIAHNHAESCLTLSEENGFMHWRSLSRAMRGLWMPMLDRPSSTLGEVEVALEEYLGGGYQLGVTALYALLCQSFIGPESTRGRAGNSREGTLHGR